MEMLDRTAYQAPMSFTSQPPGEPAHSTCPHNMRVITDSKTEHRLDNIANNYAMLDRPHADQALELRNES